MVEKMYLQEPQPATRDGCKDDPVAASINEPDRDHTPYRSAMGISRPGIIENNAR